MCGVLVVAASGVSKCRVNAALLVRSEVREHPFSVSLSCARVGNSVGVLIDRMVVLVLAEIYMLLPLQYSLAPAQSVLLACLYSHKSPLRRVFVGLCLCEDSATHTKSPALAECFVGFYTRTHTMPILAPGAECCWSVSLGPLGSDTSTHTKVQGAERIVRFNQKPRNYQKQ
jgi:hypothetical protein